MSFCRSFVAIVVFTMVIKPGLTLAQDANEAPPVVVHLHTEWTPCLGQWKEVPELKDEPSGMGRLTRELVRQAIFVTLTNDFGITVRDRTLFETIPETGNVTHLAALTRRDHLGRWKVKLYILKPDAEGKVPDEIPFKLWAEKPLWEKTFKYRSRPSTVYRSGAPVMEAASRTDFVDGLKQLGFERSQDVPQADPLTEAKITGWSDRLLEVDFVAQFDVLRQVHQAIDKHGETPELLGLLARGYAQLGLMTTHSWNSSTEVFVARSLLYAHRMMASTNDSDLSLWHHAYAFGLAGLQRTALASVDRINQQKEDKPAGDQRVQDPLWTDVIEPYLHWDREGLRDIADTDELVRPWALRLYFQQVDDYRYEDEVQAAYKLVFPEIPSAWGIYAGLNRYRSLLRTTRVATPAAMATWARTLPVSVGNVADLPMTVQKATRGKPQKNTALNLLRRKRAVASTDALTPKTIADALRSESATDTSLALSWSALAFLVEEEQFLQVARYMEMALDATESDHSPTVARLLPMVEGHRYQPYISSFRYRYRNRDGDHATQYQNTLRQIRHIPDGRQNMATLIQSVVNAWGPNPDHVICKRNHDYTARSYIEYIWQWSNNWVPKDKKWGKRCGDELRAFLPHALIGARFNAQCAENPPPGKLRSWKKILKHDAAGLEAIGLYYLGQDDTDKAVSFLEKSIKLKCRRSSSDQLANLHLKLGNRDAWERTLNKLMQTTDDSMTRAAVAKQIADQHSLEGRWHKAKPYAEIAAGVWSAGGLWVAADVTEQLGLWDESERWIKAGATSYPSYSGSTWYFWCRRTGRGDLEAARKLESKYFGRAGTGDTRTACTTRGTYLLLEGDLEAALKEYEKALTFYNSISCTCMVARLARETGKPERVQEVIEQYRRFVHEMDNPEIIFTMGLDMMDLIEAEQVDEKLIEKLNGCYRKIEPINASMTSYLIGIELQRLGAQKLAKEHFRNSLNCYHREVLYSTLAGHELCQLDGTSRPDDHERSAADIWLLPTDSLPAGSAQPKDQ